MVATDLDLPFDVLCDFASKVTLDAVVRVDGLTAPLDLCIGEIADLCVVVDFKSTEDLVRPRTPDPKDIGETDLDPFVPWEVYSGNTCHV